MADVGLFWQWLIDALTACKPTALLIVVDSHGSSPGSVGAKMAVTPWDDIGTIGGGMIEAGMINTARAMLNDNRTEPAIVRRAHHASKTVQPSGMICGGEQTVLIYPCRQADKVSFEDLLDNCHTHTPVSLKLSQSGLQLLRFASNAKPAFSGGNNWSYLETIGLYKRAYVIGGGHVGLALSRVLDMLNFDITVIDDRAQLATLQTNPYARQKWTIGYDDIARHIPEGKDVFVFIMTHSHRSDERVLLNLAGKQLAYLGLLGSLHKIDCIKHALASKLSSQQLQSLRAPMGLAIASHTPEEIAISIAAEVIKHINSQN